jgi:hypothetical protein
MKTVLTIVLIISLNISGIGQNDSVLIRVKSKVYTGNIKDGFQVYLEFETKKTRPIEILDSAYFKDIDCGFSNVEIEIEKRENKSFKKIGVSCEPIPDIQNIRKRKIISPKQIVYYNYDISDYFDRHGDRFQGEYRFKFTHSYFVNGVRLRVSTKWSRIVFK